MTEPTIAPFAAPALSGSAVAGYAVGEWVAIEQETHNLQELQPKADKVKAPEVERW